jgi:hypothetical protein
VERTKVTKLWSEQIMECWSNGVMEYCKPMNAAVGVYHSTTPLLHYSNTPSPRRR